MRVRHAFVALLLGAATVVVTAAPADAHGVAGIQPSNLATRVLRIDPPVRGLRVRAIDLGDKLELENRTGHELVVLGYNDEPYLRVGPGGVDENVRSPAVYLNRTRTGNVPVPRTADPTASPQWRRIGSGTMVRWHDHRAHWLGVGDPPAARRAPGSRHLVQRWTVALTLASGARAVVRGDVVWIPGPSPWGWVGLAVALGGVVVALGATRLARPAVAVGLLAMIVGETAHIFGSWAGTTVGATTKLAASAYALGGIAVAAVAFGWVLRRGIHAAAPLLLLAGLFLALAGGLADVTVLYRSQLPTTLPDTLARLEVAAVIGLGTGTAVLGALRLRVTSRPDRPAVTREAVGAGRG